MEHHFAAPIAVFILLLFAGVVVAAIARRVKGIEAYPYERTEKLFTAAERSFLGVLERIFGDQHRILGKVRLADIIQPRKGLSSSARTTALNRIDRKHVDFAICDLRTLKVIGVVELDDSTHKRPDARRKDEVKDKALTAAGVPVVRIPARRGYQLADVRAELAVLLNR